MDDALSFATDDGVMVTVNRHLTPKERNWLAEEMAQRLIGLVVAELRTREQEGIQDAEHTAKRPRKARGRR